LPLLRSCGFHSGRRQLETMGVPDVGFGDLPHARGRFFPSPLVGEGGSPSLRDGETDEG